MDKQKRNTKKPTKLMLSIKLITSNSENHKMRIYFSIKFGVTKMKYLRQKLLKDHN